MADDVFGFTRDHLRRVASRFGPDFWEAEPFPYVVLDEFLPEPVALRVLQEFPALEVGGWVTSPIYDLGRRAQYASTDEGRFSPFLRDLLHHLNSGPVRQFLEDLTGVPDLLPDPEIGRTLRHFKPGGSLAIHADFNWHRALHLHRRINLIYYVNREWFDEWEGHLELWDAAMKRCEVRIAPRFNRAIVFAPTDTGYHGFPAPLRCPPGETRKSINLYYYTATPPAADHRVLAMPDFMDRRAGASEASRRLVRNLVPLPIRRAVRALLRRG